MPETSTPRELKTKPLQPQKQVSLATLHAIAHIRWTREGHQTFEAKRARLLNDLSRLHWQMNAGIETRLPPIQYFLLGGQTVMLEDLDAVRPDLVSLLAIYNASGRLGVGPWYVNVDEALVSGEALIRNLLAARADAVQYGVKLLTIAYSPDSTGHIAQLPQILRGFGIDAAFIPHGAPVAHLPFRWHAPDSSTLLVVNNESHKEWPLTHETADDVLASVESQRSVRPDGPFLWLFEAGTSQTPMTFMLDEIKKRRDLPVQQTELTQYVRLLRHELPDEMRPGLAGELRMQSLRPHAYLFPGTLSTRIHLKQSNAYLQERLAYAVEPWLTIALTHTKMPYAQNTRALLDHCWRMLLKNQSVDSLRGTGIDAVHDENDLRFRQINDVSQAIITDVLDTMPGTPHQPGIIASSSRTHIMVWNPHNWPVRQAVECDLELPTGQYPAKLYNPEGEEVLFGWKPASRSVGGKLSFLADAPAVGYAAYTLALSDNPPSERMHVRHTSGVAISNGSDTILIEDGGLTWRHEQGTIRNLLEFHDGGDAGDVYNYSPPEPDLIVQADLTDDIRIESSPVYERLIVRHRMRVAVGLRPDRSRSRGLRLMELVTTITLYEGLPGVHFHTEFVNTARDHRLRAHINTGIVAENVIADTPYALVERPTSINGPMRLGENDKNLEAVINVQPIRRVVAVNNGLDTLNLMVRGLPEYEAIPKEDGVTLALTLVRAVGWLSRDDLTTRTALVAPLVEVPGAQEQRPLQAEFALTFTPSEDRCGTIRVGRKYAIPLQAYQYDRIPQRKVRGYLSVVSDIGLGADSDGLGAIMTAFKPPEKGRGWIVRLYNPHERPVEVFLTPHKRPDKVYLVSLAEEPEAYIETDANGRACFVINPNEVVTVRFLF